MKRVDWTGKSVLEYGCGGGYFTVWMAKQGARVTAIEMSPCAIARFPPRLASAKATISCPPSARPRKLACGRL